MILHVYQAKSGALYVRSGQCTVRLSKAQIDRLQLVVFEIEDFDLDAYKAVYMPEQPLIEARTAIREAEEEGA